MPVQDARTIEQAFAIAHDGAAAHHDELVRLAGAVAPVAPTLASVLADHAAPDVARQRAFGLATGPRFNPSAPLAKIA